MHPHLVAAQRYAADVASGATPVCELIRLAVQRQADDLARAPSADWPWVFVPELAVRPCEFIELLPHIKGQWARRGELLTLQSWQCFAITTLFGWVHRDTGLRRFTEAYLEVARKNAKSTLAAGLALYMLGADGEEGAEVYTAATTRDQARIVFDDAAAMVRRVPELRHMLGIEPLAHSLVIEHTASKMLPLAAEGSTLDGLNVHCAVLDEIHAHKRRDVYDVIDTARGAREQSLLLMITTAGSNRAGIGYERRSHLVKVLGRALREDRLFGLVYTLDEGDDPLDPAVWPKANPNFGVSVLADEFQTAADKARAMASAMNNFLTKRLNVWVNADSSWMDMIAWDACGDATLTLDQVQHLPCIAGLDLASKIDIAARVLIFYEARFDHYYLIPTFWLPERAVENSANSQYQGWARSGHLEVSEGDVTDYDAIEDAIRLDMGRLNLLEVAYDPWQATQLASHLLEEGAPMVEFRQTVQNLSDPMKELEALVISKRITHNANPAMTWMMSNVVCHRDKKDNIYPNKERPENKIDGPVAAIFALARHIANHGQAQASVYETHGVTC